MHHLLTLLADWGINGLLIAMAIEGASLPFPGVVLALTYGYLLHPTFLECLALAVAMSVVYSLSSYIPFGIGLKLETLIPQHLQRKLTKAQSLFQQYGLWCITLSRPFGVGNYISYVAGMCKVKLFPYGLLTFLGIFPWSVATLLLGSVFKGNAETALHFFAEYQWYVYGALLTGVLAAATAWYFWRQRQKLSKR